MKTQWNVYTDE